MSSRVTKRKNYYTCTCFSFKESNDLVQSILKELEEILFDKVHDKTSKDYW